MKRAKVVSAFNTKANPKECWMIMIQMKKGARYKYAVLVDNKPYWTYNKNEAIEKTKRLNKEFSEI
jgi:hypothetical protein